MTTTTRLLRIPHHKDANTIVLVNVSAQKADLLELNLLATEGEAPYSYKVAQKQTKQLRASSYTGTDDEWQAILRWLLLHETPTTTCSMPLDQVELVVHSIETEKEINVIVRQNIKGITHRLGTIQLLYDDTAELGLFDWNILALAERDAAEGLVSSMKHDHVKQQQDVADLRRQLQQLVEAKKHHEDELLEKFRLLLNSKKAKIRDQKRLLSTAKVDRATAEHVSTSRGGTGTKVDRKGKGKRRLDDDDEEGMEAQEAEDLETEPENERSPELQSDTEATPDEEDSTVSASVPPASKAAKPTESTPKPAANTTHDDSSDSGFEDAAPMSQRTRSNGGASQKAANSARDKPPSPPKPGKSPPVRPLPFRHAATTQDKPVISKSTPAAPIDDDETTDDEL